MRLVFSFATKCPPQPLITNSLKRGSFVKNETIQLKFDQIACLKKIRFLLEKFISSLLRFVGTVFIIVGVVFGSVAALAFAGILIWWTFWKKRRNTRGTEGKCCIHAILSNEQ